MDTRPPDDDPRVEHALVGFVLTVLCFGLGLFGRALLAWLWRWL